MDQKWLRFNMGSERIQFNVHIEQQQRLKKNNLLSRSPSLSVNEPLVKNFYSSFGQKIWLNLKEKFLIDNHKN